MKRVKIMLLSLALFAVVGGALAFKALTPSTGFCTAPAYNPSGTNFYCSFDPGGNQTTTTFCVDYHITSTTDATPVVKPVCTSAVAGATEDADCATTFCTSRVALKVD